jgi:flagellar hook-associated protein 1 FlgK
MGLNSVGIGISGLLAFQKSMATASHNIANADTEGFSRQRVDLSVNDPLSSAAGFIGTGTGISRISRVWDKFTADNLNAVTSNHSLFSTMESLNSQVDNIFSDESSGLSPKIQDFFISMQAVSESPSSSSAKRQFLAASDSLANRFNSLNSLVSGLETESQGRIKNLVREINSYTAAISDLNSKIVNASVSSNSFPNDLLDQRDRLMLKLSEKINVNQMENSNGSVSVYIANGQPLITERYANKMTLMPNEFDNSILDVGISTSSSSGNESNLSGLITSGELGAVLDFRENVLPGTKNEVGRLAAWVANTINQQHAVSVDENGNFGQNVFQISRVLAKSDANNTGNAILDVGFAKSLNDELTNNSYLLEKTATSWQITNIDTGNSNVFASGSPPPLTFEGMDIDLVSGTASVGDRYLVEPTASFASSIRAVINSPSSVATAYPITVSSVKDYGLSTTTGELDYAAIQILLPTVPAELQDNFVITYDESLAEFSVATQSAPSVILATQPYTPTSTDQNISYGVWSFSISGNIPDGAQFEVNTTMGTQPSGDNRGIADMGAKQFQNLFLGNTETIHGVYENIVANTGSLAHNSSINSNAQNALLSQATQRRDEVSGVNLDEEAATLIKLQQAYQASAKVIQIADKMFQILMGVM